MNKLTQYLDTWNFVHAPDGRESGSCQTGSWADNLAESDQFDALMSLALDDELSPSEEEAFDRMLAEDSSLEDIWDEWQAFDYAFQTAPNVDPPYNFVSSFEDRLVKRERRRKLWLGVGIGAIAVLLWGSLLLGLAGAGAYVMFNQADWLATIVRVLVQSSATVHSQVTMFVAALSAALSTPQVQGMAVAYFAFSGLALWYWARFLRRSVGAESSVAAS